MLDVTINSPEMRDALLDVFVKNCYELQPCGSKKVACGKNVVTVYKDENWDNGYRLFDVIHCCDNKFSECTGYREGTGYCGVHEDEFEDFVRDILVGRVRN